MDMCDFYFVFREMLAILESQVLLGFMVLMGKMDFLDHLDFPERRFALTLTLAFAPYK